MTILVSTLALRSQDGAIQCRTHTEPASASSRPGFLALPTVSLSGDPDGATARRAAFQALQAGPAEDTGSVPGPPTLTVLDGGATPDIPLFDAGRWSDPSGSTPDVWCFLATGQGGPWERPQTLLQQWSTGDILVDPRTRRILMAIVETEGSVAAIAKHLQETAPSVDPATNEWMPGVHILPVRTPTLPPATHTNCVLVGTVAIDPASPYPEEQERLDGWIDQILGRDRPLTKVLLTHDHADHFADARRLADRWGVPVEAHAMTRDRLPPGTVDMAIEDGQVIPAGQDGNGGPLTLRAIHTPGHAKGHLCYLEPLSGTMVAGDMVAGIGTILIDPLDGHMGQYLESLERLRSLDTQVMIPAHGEPIGQPASRLVAYHEHRLGREAKVAAALSVAAKPSTPEELVPVAYSDTPEFLHGLAERSLIAHLQKLVEDGRTRIDGDRYEWVGP